jgi:hypothetical protein
MHSCLIVDTEETRLKLSESKWDNANPNPLHPNTLLHTMLNTNEAQFHKEDNTTQTKEKPSRQQNCN